MKLSYLNGEKNTLFPSPPTMTLLYRAKAKLPLALANLRTCNDDVTSMAPRRRTAPRRSQWHRMAESVRMLKKNSLRFADVRLGIFIWIRKNYSSLTIRIHLLYFISQQTLLQNIFVGMGHNDAFHL